MREGRKTESNKNEGLMSALYCLRCGEEKNLENYGNGAFVGLNKLDVIRLTRQAKIRLCVTLTSAVLKLGARE